MKTQMTSPMTPSMNRRGPGRQRGASSLFLTVILVMVVMLLAVTSAVLSSTQFRLAGNLQFENVAFNLAEGAIASAENWLSTGTHGKSDGFTTYSSSTTPQLYPLGYTTTYSIDPLTMTWADTNSLKVDTAGDQRYIVEKYGADNQPLGTGLDTGGRPLTGCQKVDVFLISALGKSARGTSKAVQTTYSVPSC
jgi:Tfp pilus assembly protein PilX